MSKQGVMKVRTQYKVTVLAICMMASPGSIASAQTTGAMESCQAAPAAGDAGVHSSFDRLLRTFVRPGKVDYRCFQQEEKQLDRYLATLAETDPRALSAAEALAFWINAYNAFTIKLILSRYPDIESIKDIPRRWKRRDWLVGGERYSLDHIEHEILRKEFEEPRIHFAIVCASQSCPDLAPEAYVADRLDAQLTHAARNFLADRNKGFQAQREDRGSRGYRYRIFLSSIFKWFRKDFGSNNTELLDFLEPYVSLMDRTFLEEHRDELSIRFMNYDWSLNGSSFRPPNLSPSVQQESSLGERRNR